MKLNRLNKKQWVVLVVVCIGIISLKMMFSETEEMKTEYLTSKVRKGDLIKEITATGTINPVNVVSVGTQVTGIVNDIYVDYNDVVKKGQILAKLDTDILDARKISAASSMKKTKIEMEQAERNLKRNKSLFEKNYIAKIDLEEAEVAYQSAVADYEISLSDYNQAETNLSYAIIKSPVSGIVISREVEEGQTVSSNLEVATMFEIAEDLSTMQIETSISEADIGFVKTGQNVSFSVDAFEYDDFIGKVNLIRLDPSTIDNVVTYTVLIDIDNSNLKLLPGMTAFATLEIENKKDILILSNNLFDFENDLLMGNPDVKKESLKKELSSGQVLLYKLNPNKTIEAVAIERGVSNDTISEIISDNIKVGDVFIEDVLNEKTMTNKTANPRGGGGPKPF